MQPTAGIPSSGCETNAPLVHCHGSFHVDSCSVLTDNAKVFGGIGDRHIDYYNLTDTVRSVATIVA